VSEMSTDSYTAVTAPPIKMRAARASLFEVRHAARTHTGLVREHNEDDFLTMPAVGVYMVADGMGGHAAGKVASELCVEAVRSYYGDGDASHALEEDQAHAELSVEARDLAHALKIANAHIFQAALRDPLLENMGTTAVAAALFGDSVAIAHAGDSRCYLLRDGHLGRVTADHSLANFLYALGRTGEAQMAEVTMSHVIMRALGLEPDVDIEAQEMVIRTGDRLLLCSDGLSDLVNDTRLQGFLLDMSLDRDALCDALISAALDEGGRDNITVLVVDVMGRIGTDEKRAAHEETIEMPTISGSSRDTADHNIVPPETAEASDEASAEPSDATGDPSD